MIPINLRTISIAVMVATGMIGAVQVAGPESLGISAVAIRWLGIIAAGLAVVQGFLPRVQGPSADPKVLADRIMALTPAERLDLQAEVERRHRAGQDGEAGRG